MTSFKSSLFDARWLAVPAAALLTHGTDRVMSLRGAVNFDQGSPKETTLQHLDPASGETAGGFAETVENIELVGSRVVDHIVANWPEWSAGVPKP
jgi:purine nucleoside permease